MKDNKFALISHVLPPSWSGQAVILGRLLKAFNKRNYHLLLSTPNSIQTVADNLQKYYIPNLPLRRYSAIFHIEVLLRSLIIFHILKNKGCKCIIAASGSLYDIPSAYYASKLLNIGYFPYLFDDFVYQWMLPKQRAIALKYEQIIFPQANGVFVPNEFMKEEIEKRLKVKATIIRNLLDEEPAIKDYNKSKKDERINIVYSGAVYHVNNKSLRNLINALEQIGNKNITLHLYTAQDREVLLSYGIESPFVVYHSHVSYQELKTILHNADILFLPFSFSPESFPVIRTSSPAKLGDYLASGTPILAHVPSNTFVNWYLNKHHCGIVVDQEDNHKLIQSINTLISNDTLRKELTYHAFQRAIHDFSPRNNQEIFIDLINNQ